MLISGPKELEALARTLYDLLNDGYPILVAYPERRQAPEWLWESFLCGVYKEWLWTSLLSDDNADNKQSTTRLVHQDNFSEKGESPWSCSPCDFAGQSFEDFTTHLKSEEHAHFAVDSVVGAPKHNPKMVDIAKFH
ncbi:hypothetical protein V5N11_010542 [Cardamine amara subsp. amara]|uniref:Uncharacterized protein n=1 Tax=Cardamine amara subsp. amara TaxID=228776 RepID=A0ABD1AQ41_CARAN